MLSNRTGLLVQQNRFPAQVPPPNLGSQQYQVIAGLFLAQMIGRMTEVQSIIQTWQAGIRYPRLSLVFGSGELAQWIFICDFHIQIFISKQDLGRELSV